MAPYPKLIIISLYVYMYIVYTHVSFPLLLKTAPRHNLLLDNIYGLVVVFLALVGFISLAWLRDQLLHGGAPKWLSEDQRAATRQRMRRNHDSMDLLRVHLEQSSKRSRRRAREPDRVAASTELNELNIELNSEVRKLQLIHYDMWDARIHELKAKEMELLYDMDMEGWHHTLMLKEARKKQFKVREAYTQSKTKELEDYRKEVSDLGDGGGGEKEIKGGRERGRREKERERMRERERERERENLL